MTHERIEEIAGRIVELVFGAGYFSPAAHVVFTVSAEIMENIPESNVPELSAKIVEMCKAVGREAEAVGFDE